MTAIEKLIDTAIAELGYLEKSSEAVKANRSVLYEKTAGAGKDNYTKFWAETKPTFQGQAWCQDFVYYCFVRTFGKELAHKMLFLDSWKVGDKWDNFYTPDWANNFKLNDASVQTSGCRVGDIVYFKNSSRIHHVGIVTEVTSSYILTIEGNTSAVDEVVIANGGGVFQKRYTRTPNGIDKVAWYGRPKYSLYTEGRPTIAKGYKDSERGGNHCYQLQHALNDLEFTDDEGKYLAEDGSCGSRTVQALKSFQYAYQLEVTGICNDATWEKLDRAEKSLVRACVTLGITSGMEYHYDDTDGEYVHLSDLDIWIPIKCVAF